MFVGPSDVAQQRDQKAWRKTQKTMKYKPHTFYRSTSLFATGMDSRAKQFYSYSAKYNPRRRFTVFASVKIN
jgi:hypothetical protein